MWRLFVLAQRYGFFELARVLVRFDHVVRRMVNVPAGPVSRSIRQPQLRSQSLALLRIG
jgi:hypothetical protein